MKNAKYLEIINDINNAFYRLECFANGTLSKYEHFDFHAAFTNLFNETLKPDNYTNENCARIGKYWQLLDFIQQESDKNWFKNENALDNTDFEKDCNAIADLCWNCIEKFDQFTTPAEIAQFEHEISITDITKKSFKCNAKAGRPKADPKPPAQYIKGLIPGFEMKFVEVLKAEFHASKCREIAQMILALIKMGHLNKPTNLKELLLSFTNYFGSQIIYKQFTSDFKLQNDADILIMQKRIGNIKNKNSIK